MGKARLILHLRERPRGLVPSRRTDIVFDPSGFHYTEISASYGDHAVGFAVMDF
jgi:hypothetical protein